MTEEEESRLLKSISAKLNGIMGGIAVGVVMGSVIFWNMDAAIKENKAVSSYNQKEINTNTRDIAVINARMKRVKYEKVE